MGYMLQELECPTETLKIGDRVRLHPRFTSLFPDELGVIIAVTLDPKRPLFNEYAVEFPDHSVASVFQFQVRRSET